MQRLRCDETQAWVRLQSYFEDQGSQQDLRTAFGLEPGRFNAFSQEAPYLFADLSKNLIDHQSQNLLFDLAKQCELEKCREDMFAGCAINTTEARAVMHYLLRWPKEKKDLPESLRHPISEVHATLDQMLSYAEQVRQDEAITDIVNIGIGGSDLGPVVAIQALDAYKIEKKRFHFVSSIDGLELGAVLKQIRPASTLFIVASKSFTTHETITNAQSAREWFLAAGGTQVARHFCAVTSNVEAARQFGIEKCFGFWDWVGGRFSLWSSIGLPIAISIGPEGFRDLLAGAHAMDMHFKRAPLEKNLPIRLALLDLWYRNFHGFTSRNVAPYYRGLRRMPAYLQQLEMESNGKSVDLDGQRLPYQTAPVIWGELGANGQHAYFQLLHQGTDVIPVEFLVVKKATHGLEIQHRITLANALAQSRALMMGQAESDGHRHMPGNRPSTTLMLDELSPASLGALIALYEHRVFVSGALWGINSFDQWGVQLGKVMANDMTSRLQTGDMDRLDASSAGLLKRLRT